MNKIFLLLIILFSCNKVKQEKEQAERFNFPNKYTEILVEEFPQIQHGLQSPYILEYDNHQLILQDNPFFTKDSIIQIIDLENQKNYLFGKVGEEPGAHVSISKVLINQKNEIITYDLTKGRFQTFAINDNDSIFYTEEFVDLNEDLYGANKPVFINDTLLGATSLMDVKRIVLFTDKGKLVNKFGNYPFTKLKNTPDKIHYQAYQSLITASNENIAIASRYSDRISIYSLSGKKIKDLHGPAFFEPEFIVKEVNGHPVFAQKDNMKKAYTGIDSNDEFLYVLFSGKTRTEFGSEGSNSGEFIFKFDWKGNLIDTFHFDIPVVTFAIGDDVLYVLVDDEQKTIRKINLN